MKRKKCFCAKDPLPLRQTSRLDSTKLTDAALIQISDPTGNGVAGWKHALLHFLRVHMEATLQEVFDWAEEMERVRAALVLGRGEFPGPSALCKSFDRAPMRV